MERQFLITQFQEFFGVPFSRWIVAFSQEDQLVSCDVVLTDRFAENIFRDAIAV
jgi:hypothetical protein